VTPVRQSANHVTLWQAERALSVVLLGLVPAALIIPSQASDYLLALATVMHFHWGLEAIVTDYVRESLFGKAIPKVSHAALLLFSAATLAGLFMMAYKEQGIATTVRKIWAIEAKN
jgi:succinate dehydrogenase (ubiquinone) membrane anchor subunit